VNNYTKRNFAILIAGSLFAGMLLSAVSAKSSSEIDSDAAVNHFYAHYAEATTK
jgi:hypothetical protein